MAWIFTVLSTGGCTEAEETPAVTAEPRTLKISSDTAVAYFSCMAHYPLVNPIVLRALTVPEDEDFCRDDSFDIRVYFSDAVFLDGPLGAWAFTGDGGLLSLESGEGTPQFQSALWELRERG